MSLHEVPATLHGRAPECRSLADLLASSEPPAVVLVHGEPGIGKTSLLAWAQIVARGRGTRVLTASGTPTESDLPFSGLHQLLRPVLDDPDPAPRRRHAVVTAMSAHEAAGAALFGTARSVLELFAELSAPTGLFVCVDDVQWLDRPSRDVLTFVGRRLDTEPVRMALAARDDPPPGLAQAALGGGWRTLTLGRLDEQTAGELLDAGSPHLPADLRRRILDEAAGNPLALKELPKTIRDATAPDHVNPLPVSGRLEAAFAARLPMLPEATQRLVVIAAAQDSDSLGELLDAGRVGGASASLQDLDPAVAVGLVEVDQDRIRFGHPLARSAVYQHAGPAARTEAHRALARTAQSLDRRAWHAAAAADGPDESVAQQLDDAAERAADGGAIETSLRAYEEAARLSVDEGRRAVRLLRAVEMAEEVGPRRRALELMAAVDSAALDPGERARLDWLREVMTDGAWTGGARVPTFADIARRMHAAGDTRRAGEILMGTSLRSWWSNLDPATSALVAAVADEIAPEPDDPVHLVITALAAPVERGAEALASYGRMAVSEIKPEPMHLHLLGMGATGVGDHPHGIQIFAASIAEARRQGRTATLINSLVGTAWAEVHVGRLRRAEIAAEEGIQLAEEFDLPLWAATATAALASARGLRGDIPSATALAGRAEEIYLGVGANELLAQVRTARGFTALARGDHDEAFTQLYRVFTPRDASYHQHHRTFLVAELAEAAVREDQRDAARAVIDELGQRWERTRSPILGAGLLTARPLLASDGDAEHLYRVALDDGLVAWPLHRARVHLAYGAWLRRRRRVSEAREPLRIAHETFAGLGATPWAERAVQELRAAGDAPVERPTAAWEHLTSQELQIASLAAEGFTNRQIGERLFLSHRTVGTHLYHIFPKLGISSRGQLAAAMAGLRVPEDGGAANPG